MVVFVEGFLYGLFLSMLIGPVFFALIRTSIDKGFKAGAHLALGIALSDALAALVVYFGLSLFTENPAFQNMLGYVGGTLMVLFGLVPFGLHTHSRNFLPEHLSDKPKRGYRYTLEGVFLNLFNPFVYIFWISTVGYLTVARSYDLREVMFFFVTTFATVLSIDLLKAFIADKITQYLTARIIRIIDQIAGACLIGVGIRLLVFAMYGI